MLTGEGAEGVSSREFVMKITGSSTIRDGADGAADALDLWISAVGKPSLPPLILIDEFDEMVPQLEARFLERLRGMLGRIVLVLSTSQQVDLIYDHPSRTSPFYNKLELAVVGLLGPAAAEQLIEWGNGLLSAGDADILRRWAGRHPFYLQLLGRHLVDARRKGESIEGALDRFRTEASARLRALWGALGEKERRSLLGLLEGRIVQRASLRSRGLVTEEGVAFGEVLTDWLKEG